MKAVIFDFDGTIMDSESIAFSVWSEIYKDFGANLTLKTWVSCVGKPMGTFNPCSDIERQIGYDIDHEKITQRKQDAKAKLCNELSAMPGINELFNKLNEAGIPIAVGSSSNKQWVEHHLTRLNLKSLAQTISCIDDVKQGKPEPDIFLNAAKNLDISPEHCVVIEDSMPGVAAAKAAGMKVLAVPNQITKFGDFTDADWLVNSIEQIKDLSYFGEIKS